MMMAMNQRKMAAEMEMMEMMEEEMMEMMEEMVMVAVAAKKNNKKTNFS
jgi:hypothetical protein